MATNPTQAVSFVAYFRTFLLRSTAIIMASCTLGVPINTPARFVAFFSIVLVLFSNTVSARLVRWLVAAAVLLSSVAVQKAIPATNIEEGHNVFIRLADGEAIEKGLPARVYSILKDQFAQRYPLDKRCDPKEPGCWVRSGVPLEPFAFSADGYFTENEWSRKSAEIDFRNAATLRLGGLNEIRYNWYGVSDVSRLDPPFFVVFRWPKQAVGSQLCWSGYVVWEVSEREFESPVSEIQRCKLIEARDVGLRAFGISILQEAPLSMKLVKSRWLSFWDFLLLSVRLVSAAAITWCLLAAGLKQRSPFFLGLAALVITIWLAPEFLYQFPVRFGGDDGLAHEAFGRSILSAAMNADWKAALLGDEPVYYYMPGLRYFRALEKLAFGETDFGYIAILALFLLVLFSLVRRLTTAAFATIFLITFVAVPFGDSFGLGFQPYLQIARMGYPDTLGYFLFLAATFFSFRLVEDGEPDKAFLSGLLFALAVFVRPNLVPAAAIFLLMCSFALFKNGRYTALVHLTFGVVLALFMPIHNWLFGHRFVLLTSAVDIKENLFMSPAKYVEAALWAFHQGGDSTSYSEALRQIDLWLRGLPGGDDKALHLLLLGGAAAATIIGIKCWRILTLGATAGALQLPLLFWHPNGRFALLSWLLSSLVVLAQIGSAGLLFLSLLIAPFLTYPLVRVLWPPCSSEASVVLTGPFHQFDPPGFAYVAELPTLAASADTSQNALRSRLIVCEDRRPLGPMHSLHSHVKWIGKGRYSHWDSYLVFSSGDNSDPNTNGRKYWVPR